MRRTTILGAVLSAGLTVGGAILAVSGGTAQAATLPNNWYGAAPYVMPLDNDPPDLGPVMDATSQKSFMLAFILAPNSGGCTATWDGTAPLSDPTVAGVVSKVRAKGGDVSVSIGGFGGTKLGQTCSSPAATAAAYQQVINQYQLKAIDFDLEEPEYENLTAVNNELGAAQILQNNNPGLYVSITTAGTPSGTGFFGQNVLTNSKNLGFTPNNFAIMPFDNGFSGGGASQVSALEAFHGLLMNTFGWSSAFAYNHEGVSLMNGRSDAGEMFPQSEFTTVFNYATSHGLSRFTFWSINRDRQCSPPDNNGRTSGTCSSVAQASWDFTKFTARFAGATPPQSPPPTTGSPTPGTCSAPPWNSTTAYTGGMQVSYGGHTWTAKWWTQGDTPGNNSQDVWTDNGSC